MNQRQEMRDFTWEEMKRLERAKLGRIVPVSDDRRKLVLDARHPAARRLTTRPEADGFVRADMGSVLFRDASQALRQAVPPELRNRAMPSAKGLEYRWTQLTQSDVRQLVDVVLSLLGTAGQP